MRRLILLLLAGAVCGSLGTLGVMLMRPNRSAGDYLGEEIKHWGEIEEHQEKICQAISDADRIEVVVHSWSEEINGDRQPMLVPPCEEYLRFELTDSQRDGLMTAVAHTEKVTKETVSYCSFFANFTIDFWEGAEVAHKLQIGFDCKRVRLLRRTGSEWVEVEGAESECLLSSLRGFLGGIGINALQFSPYKPVEGK